MQICSPGRYSKIIKSLHTFAQNNLFITSNFQPSLTTMAIFSLIIVAGITYMYAITGHKSSPQTVAIQNTLATNKFCQSIPSAYTCYNEADTSYVVTCNGGFVEAVKKCDVKSTCSEGFSTCMNDDTRVFVQAMKETVWEVKNVFEKKLADEKFKRKQNE